ncbi:PD-(D/E)XK motif protein [Corynebacterium urogenitale]|nr:PD-(D/E)XK motif protein [Corynebacterium urogenitale]
MKTFNRGKSFETLSDLHATLASRNVEQLFFPFPAFSKLGSSYFVTQSNEYGIKLPIDPEWASRFKKIEGSYKYRAVQTSSFAEGSAYFLQIKLTEPSFLQSFAWFIDSLIEDMPAQIDSITPMVIRHLEQWENLLKSPAKVLPSIELQAGLLFELLTLERLTALFGPDVLGRWTGPDRLRHDFELPDASLECKSTLKLDALTVKINGQHQLEPMGEKPLHLLVQQFEKDPDGPLSIPIVINRLLKDSHLNQDDLFLKLADFDVHYSLLNEPGHFQRFRRREAFAFVIEADFPRVKSVSLHPRIDRVVYEINLSEPEQVPGYYTPSKYLEV